MTSVIYFKLKNAIQQQQLNFDGSVIQIGDVKRLVAQKQGLGPEGAAEITLYDPNTNEEYTDVGKVIPRNTLVLVKRAPATKFKPLLAGDGAAAAAAPGGQPSGAQQGAAPASAAEAGEFGGDYYSQQPVVGEEETRALQSLLQGTAANWQREVRQASFRGRGRGRGGRGGAPPDYRCPRYMRSMLGLITETIELIAACTRPCNSTHTSPLLAVGHAPRSPGAARGDAFLSCFPAAVCRAVPPCWVGCVLTPLCPERDPPLLGAGARLWASTGCRTAPPKGTPASTENASGRQWAFP